MLILNSSPPARLKLPTLPLSSTLSDLKLADLAAGEVTERLKVLVSKTSVGLAPTEGSNPSLSALIDP